MARRGRSSIHPAWYIAVTLNVVIALGVGYYVVGRVADPYRTVAALDVGMYLENSNSLRGNTYKLTGSIWNSLGWSVKHGRLFSVAVDRNMENEILPILVPAAFNHVNIQKGQKFDFKIEVDRIGILKVLDLQKE